MKRILLSFIMILAASFCQHAQSQWKFRAIPEIGFVWNSVEFGGDVRLNAGAHKNGWMLGGGAGWDYHRINSLPLYVQGRKSFSGWKNKPFLAGSIGANLPGEKHVVDEDRVYIDDPGFARPPWGYDYHPGMYVDAGVGMDFPMSEKLGLVLSLSYSYKTMKETYYSTVWNGNNESSEEKYENNYLMNRLALRVGLRF